MSRFFDAVVSKIHAWADERRKLSWEKEKAEVARRFNDIYCFDQQYVENAERLTGTAMFGILPRGGHRWMCPSCNKIHAPLSCSVWSGLQYPSCCNFPEGHRLNLNIRVRKK